METVRNNFDSKFLHTYNCFIFIPALAAVFTWPMLTHSQAASASIITALQSICNPHLPETISGQRHQQWGRQETGCEARLVHMESEVLFLTLCVMKEEIYS